MINMPYRLLKHPHAWASFLVLSLLGIAIYSNTFHNPFYFDDLEFILRNPTIKALKAADIFNYWPTRFAGFLTFAANYQIHQYRVFGYHAVNLALHVLTACLVFWFMSLTFSTVPLNKEKAFRHKGIISFFVAAIFLVHPLQTEALNYIFQRVTILAAFFYLASLCFYIKAMPGARQKSPGSKYYYGASFIMGFAAMFTKEHAATLPLTILLYDFFFLREERGIHWKQALPFLLLLPIVPLTVWITKPVVVSDIHRLLNDPLGAGVSYACTQLKVLVTYVRLFLLPVNQNLDYDYPVSHSFLEIPVLASALVLVLIIIAGIRAFPRHRLISFGIFWFFLTLIPESSIIPLLDIIYEHRMYLPLVGCSIAGVGIICHVFRNMKFRVTAVILLLIAGLWSIATYHRNKVWKDELTLWSDAAGKSPNKARPRHERGYAYAAKGEYGQALIDFNRAVELDPGFAVAYNSRGFFYQNRGAYDQALLDYAEALRLDPEFLDAYIGRGQVYVLKKEYEKAIREYERAIAIPSADTRAYFELAALYTDLGKKEEAGTLYKKVVTAHPNNAWVYYNLGDAYRRMKEDKAAIGFFEKSLALEPHYAPTFDKLASLYAGTGDKEKVIALCKKAIANHVDWFDAYYSMGNEYRNAKKFRDAVSLYRKAIAIKPGSPEAYVELGSLYCATGDYVKGIRALRKAIELEPRIAAAYNNLAVAYYSTKRFDLAIEYCDKAIERGYRVAPAFLELLRQRRGHSRE